MMKTSTFLKSIFTFALAAGITSAQAQYFTEEFEDITTLPASGWEEFNMSSPTGGLGYFQGDTDTAGGTPFMPHSGIGFLGVNYNSAGNAPGATISNWMISPEVTLTNGDVITFYTRTVDSASTVYPDRLQVRYSTNGSSNDIGANETSVGDFTNLLIDINENYSTSGFPTGYPFTWQRYDLVISGLSAATQGRFAFRYFVEDGGPQGASSNYIGIDSLSFHAGVISVNEIDPSVVLSVYPNPTSDVANLVFNKNLTEDVAVNVYDMTGRLVLSDEMYQGQLNAEISVRTLSAGAYIIDINSGAYRVRQQFVKN